MSTDYKYDAFYLPSRYFSPFTVFTIFSEKFKIFPIVEGLKKVSPWGLIGGFKVCMYLTTGAVSTEWWNPKYVVYPGSAIRHGIPNTGPDRVHKSVNTLSGQNVNFRVVYRVPLY